MSKSDELGNIPPIVPDRDDVNSHLSNRRAQGQDIVRSRYPTEKVRVSTWPVRIMLMLLTLAIGAGGYGAWYFWQEYQYDLEQADLRISDLERRLNLVGDSAEESTLNIIERLDFNFSEIDKLWAARRVINTRLDQIDSSIAQVNLANEGRDELINTNSEQIANTNRSVMGIETRLNAVAGELNQMDQSLAGIQADMIELQALRGDIQSIRQALNSGDSTVGGLIGRLEYVEQSMESVNAHRLQINESLFRLQEDIEALQRSAGAQVN